MAPYDPLMPSGLKPAHPSKRETVPTATTTLKVDGMTCGACTSAIEGGFKDVAGVKRMSVSLLSERAVVEHDPSVINARQLAEIIEDRGFDATILDSKLQQPLDASTTGSKIPTSSTQQAFSTTVAIEGMTCGACTSAAAGAF